ncbi:cilia- and flagella-associated protein 53 isoform X2 [Mobula birostris]|uniref:cilia- and flagella-associated protein 53 isoform X2 n=1 Tax=Mobula birostris TaxID=1983395 RepID=UPI003B281C3D
MLPVGGEAAAATRYRCGPRCREVTGPAPCTVAVMEKRTGPKIQSKMMKEAELDLVRDEYRNFVKDFEACKTKNILELEEQHKWLLCTIRHRLKRAMEFYKDNIEERREREQCKELQAELSHQREQELARDWQAQIEFNRRLQNQKKEEDQLFDELWEKDRLAKEERAEKELREENRKKQEALAIQLKQIAEINAKRVDQKHQKEHEAGVMKEKQRLSKLEDERLEREKVQKQKKLRDTLDSAKALKVKRITKEQEEEQALDIKLMDQALKEEADDAQALMQKKMDLRREQQLYRNYLAQKAEDEKRQEEEANRLIEADMEKTWAKRQERVRLKKEAQDRLQKEVMETRRLQIQEKLERNVKAPQQLAAERAKLEKSVEEQNQVEEEKLVRAKQERKANQQDLLTQINYQKEQREREKAERQRETEAAKLEEVAYQKKLQAALSKPLTDTEQIHPWRRKHCSEVC